MTRIKTTQVYKKKQLEILNNCYKYLLDKSRLGQRDDIGYSVQNFKNILKNLDKAYIDYFIDKDNSIQFNMLHIAAQNNNYLEVNELLENGANLDIEDSFCRRLEDIAIQINSRQIINIINKYNQNELKSEIKDLHKSVQILNVDKTLLKRTRDRFETRLTDERDTSQYLKNEVNKYKRLKVSHDTKIKSLVDESETHKSYAQSQKSLKDEARQTIKKMNKQLEEETTEKEKYKRRYNTLKKSMSS